MGAISVVDNGLHQLQQAALNLRAESLTVHVDATGWRVLDTVEVSVDEATGVFSVRWLEPEKPAKKGKAPKAGDAYFQGSDTPEIITD